MLSKVQVFLLIYLFQIKLQDYANHQNCFLHYGICHSRESRNRIMHPGSLKMLFMMQLTSFKDFTQFEDKRYIRKILL